MMKNFLKLTIATLVVLLFASGAKAQEQFKDTEIRVIKNKAFQKSLRLEIGANGALIMNKSFVYTPMGGAQLGFHITESLGLFGEGMAATTFKDTDCEELGNKFQINPIIEDITFLAGGGVSYTPIYGKFQMESGEVLYFDTFFTLGGGIAGYKRDEAFCYKDVTQSPSTTPDEDKAPEKGNQLQINVGMGQRYFFGKHISYNWSLRYMTVQKPVSPSAEGQGGNLLSDGLVNIFLMLGVSYYL
jgi:outer membrane beta-barrel protein